jgi:DNA-binding response OmpR family regulator
MKHPGQEKLMSKKKILIVEDDPAIGDLLCKGLEMEGCECLTAEHGHLGLELARKERPDLIILDLMLPGMDGYQICRLLKFDEKYKHIPIIILTGRDQNEDRLLGKETGADLYVTKPFLLDELLPEIKDLLNT